MIVLTYVSTASHALSEESLAELLIQCRDNNSKAHITGLLLYKEGNFMQTLEGPDEAVYQLYRKIRLDRRHRGVIMLLEDTITQRAFPSWTMAFQNLSAFDHRALPGFSEFLDRPFTFTDFRENPAVAQKLLLKFTEIFR